MDFLEENDDFSLNIDFGEVPATANSTSRSELPAKESMDKKRKKSHDDGSVTSRGAKSDVTARSLPQNERKPSSGVLMNEKKVSREKTIKNPVSKTNNLLSKTEVTSTDITIESLSGKSDSSANSNENVKSKELEDNPKRKFKCLTIEEDPNQYHAKPRDLSQNALKKPREHSKKTNMHIFSKLPFKQLNLDLKLINILEKSDNEGGMGLVSSTMGKLRFVP